ncbi:hypothetical protein M8J75_010963 [Diaphorina citri]|nr:hypothetical protein M8J75_010963 [Diaphorina citri]
MAVAGIELRRTELVVVHGAAVFGPDRNDFGSQCVEKEILPPCMCARAKEEVNVLRMEGEGGGGGEVLEKGGGDEEEEEEEEEEEGGEEEEEDEGGEEEE